MESVQGMSKEELNRKAMWNLLGFVAIKVAIFAGIHFAVRRLNKTAKAKS